MRVECAWCHVFLSGDPDDHVSVSHGICTDCRNKHFSDVAFDAMVNQASMKVENKPLPRTPENAMGWSEGRELLANMCVVVGMVALVVALCLIVTDGREHPVLTITAVGIAAAIFTAGAWMHLAMSGNRPADSAKPRTDYSRITAADQAAFRFITPLGNLMLVCKRCGKWLTFRETDWYANSFDKDGGRYAKVCGCGQGYWFTKDMLEKARAAIAGRTKGIAVSSN